jgi:uncharacterized protein (TIGR03083 family)
MEPIWGWIAAERRTLADLTEGLTQEQLATPSLCAGWTVRDVIAHLTLNMTFSRRQSAGALVRSGFRPNRFIQLLTVDAAKRTDAELVSLLRDDADTQWGPPGFGPLAPLTDLLVHGVDLRRPLGIDHDPDPDALRTSLDFVVQPKAGLGFTQRRHQKGLRHEATDVGWSHGEGPLVRGPARSLLAVLCNRPAPLDDLTGDGVAVLRARLA